MTPGRSRAIALGAGGGTDSPEWREVAPELAARTGSEAIACDRTGEGESDEAPGPWGADNSAAGLTRSGVAGNVVLVSHSLAGEVAFARSRPQWAAGAVDADLPQFFTPEETAKPVALNEEQAEEFQKAPSTRQTRQPATWPSGIPAAVIVSAGTPVPAPEDARSWRQAQQDFAHAAPNRTLDTAEHRSRDVPLDRPDAVVANLLKR